jgi:hypothetical protein
VTFNDDCSPATSISCISAVVTAGTSYAVQVYGFKAATGNFSLLLSVPLSGSDMFAA